MLCLPLEDNQDMPYIMHYGCWITSIATPWGNEKPSFSILEKPKPMLTEVLWAWQAGAYSWGLILKTLILCPHFSSTGVIIPFPSAPGAVVYSLSINSRGCHGPFHMNPEKDGIVNNLILLIIASITLIVIVTHMAYGRTCSILY